MKGFCKAACIFCDCFLCCLADRLCRIYGNTVSGMDSRALNVFHNTGDQDFFSVAYCVHLDFFSHQVFIYKNRVFLRNLIDDADIFFHIFITDCNPHSLSAQYVRRSHKNRIAKLCCRFLCFFCCENSMSLWSWNPTLLQNLIKQLSVLCSIYVLCRSTQDFYSHLHKRFCKLNGCLSAELYYCAVRFFHIYHIFHIFWCQRLKIQLIRNIKVCTYCFRIIVDDDRLVSFFCKCPCTVYRAEVELDTLTDTDRTGTKHKDFLFAGIGNSLVFCFFISVYGIIVRCFCRKLCRAGIYHFIGCFNAKFFSKLFYFPFCFSGKRSDHGIRKFHSFCLKKKFFCKLLCFQSLFHFH